MIGVFAREQVGQEARAGQSLRDRANHRRAGSCEPSLARPVAGPTGVGLADVLDDEVAGRAVVELLTDLLADADPRPAATGAGLARLSQVVHDPLARQVVRQRLATVAGTRLRLASVPLVPRHQGPPGPAALRALAEV